MKNLKQELKDRGLLYQNSSDEIFEKLDKGGINFYFGYDPSSDSLHLGNFLSFIVAIHLMRRGNKFIVLTGGATGMIGDPGGKDSERSFLSLQDLKNNEKKIYSQVGSILNNLKKNIQKDFKFEFFNNRDFYKGLGYINFLREVGKYITINSMINKDTVKKRIQDPNKSISYSEFSYMLLQGYDFFNLFCKNNVSLQIGGQDQWGNLVTGIELIRKKCDKDSYAITWPLIVDSSGKKFGKSEGNALWLDKNKTSPYEMYQYFMNTSDDDIEKFFKMLTLLEIKEIEKIVKDHFISPQKRVGQKKLAFEVVSIIHSKDEAIEAKKISDFIFGENKLEIIRFLDKKEANIFKENIGGCRYCLENILELIVKSGLEKSNNSARKSINSGTVYINEEKISDLKIDPGKNFLKNGLMLLRKGKKNFRIILK